ncbi:MAG TPA: hypothetical protein VGK20_09415 [Candidatus Binatia bacterium]|jgi:hypothetical protein
MRALLVAATVAASLFAAVTPVALEVRGVAVLHTTGSGGQERRTRVWYAEDDGAIWVEAATPSQAPPGR